MSAVPFEPNHLEFFATATLQKQQSYTTEQIRRWLTRLVETVDMQVLMPAAAISCNDLGNEGISGIVMLSTSHSSIHIWNKKPVPYLKMVLYSCKTFIVQPILEMYEELGARYCRWELRDRNHGSESDLWTTGRAGTNYNLISEGLREYR